MFLRIDKLQVEMPAPTNPDPNAAAAVQELLGGRFGEMSTLMNYMYQSFNFRGRDGLRQYYSLISNIATEELGHIELVAATINGLLTGAEGGDDPRETPLAGATDGAGLRHHFINTGLGALAANSQGQGWNGEYIFNTGDLVLDLLHNFFLENGARMAKIRVYEMTSHPIARPLRRGRSRRGPSSSERRNIVRDWCSVRRMMRSIPAMVVAAGIAAAGQPVVIWTSRFNACPKTAPRRSTRSSLASGKPVYHQSEKSCGLKMAICASSAAAAESGSMNLRVRSVRTASHAKTIKKS